MKYPRRPHAHCDPLCDRCTDWTERLEAIFGESAKEAMKAFWNVMEARHPGLIKIPNGEMYMIENSVQWIVETIVDGAFDTLSENATEPRRKTAYTDKQLDLIPEGFE